MSGKDKGRIALPSMLSSIRNAGRSSLYSQHEVQPFVTEPSPISPQNQNLPRTKSINAFINNVQSMPLFERNKQRFTKRISSRRLGKKGFKVDLPPKFILYIIFIFIVLPLLLGSFFLMRQILFGALKEDESHPLHKKQPHLRNKNDTQIGSDTFFNHDINATLVDHDPELNLQSHQGDLSMADQEKIVVAENFTDNGGNDEVDEIVKSVEEADTMARSNEEDNK